MKQNILFQRAEGFAIFISSIIGYEATGTNWFVFVALLLAVDLSMVGYLFNNKVGAYAYNLGHSIASPLVFGIIGYFANIELIIALSLIWLAHIGMDRAFGYGLKLESGFKHTHLGHIGKK